MAGPRAFVSHHPADDAFCRTLVAGLQAAGVDVWFDERGLPWEEFRRAAVREMPTRPAFVAVLSPDALAAERSGLTAGLALALRQTGEVRACVAVLARDCALPAGLSTFHVVDGAAGAEVARDGVLAALGLASPTAPGSAVVPGLAVVPAAPASPTARPLPVVLPPPLSDLGYRGWQLDGEDFIVPPLCLVPAGPFPMGGRGAPGEQPIHTVALPTYAVARYPVLVAEYACFVRAGHPLPATLGRLGWDAQFARLDHPVVNVSWADAVAYAAWLGRHTGERWRLPTEAEWEKAARWDADRCVAREYPWGDAFDPTRCNARESSLGGTTAAGTYPNGVSPCGAHDMAGNVREWTGSLHRPYPYAPDDGREGTAAAGPRVQRGGSWSGSAAEARAAFRAARAPDEISRLVGFRLVVEAPPIA